MDDINTLKLIAAASAHLKINGAAGARIPLLGTDKLIVIGDQEWVNENAQPVAASAAGLHDLRTAVQQMARALRDREWADLLTMDPDASELEKQIERLLATQSAKQGAQPSVLDQICDLFGIGALARSESTILANVRNVIRREECLSAIERTFFMVPAEPDEDFPDEDPGEECMLGLGRDPQQYVEQFRAALKHVAVQASVEQATGAQEVTQQAAKAETGSIATDAKFIELLSAHQAAELACDQDSSDNNREASNEAWEALVAYLDRRAPTTSTVSASGALAAADDARNDLLDEVADHLEALNDSCGDAAAYDQREMNDHEEERMHAIQHCANAVRALKRTAAQAATDKSED